MPRQPSGTAKTVAERVAAYRARQREARALAADNGNDNGAVRRAAASRRGNGNGNGNGSGSGNRPPEIADLERQLAAVSACLRELEAECRRYQAVLAGHRIELTRNRSGESAPSTANGETIRQAREDRDQRIRELLAEGVPVLEIGRKVGATTKVIRRVRGELAAASDAGPQSDHV